MPQKGQALVVSWTGYTEGYQAKRIESSQDYDEPFRFELGRGQAIPAFEEAVAGMRAGGVRGSNGPHPSSPVPSQPPPLPNAAAALRCCCWFVVGWTRRGCRSFIS